MPSPSLREFLEQATETYHQAIRLPEAANAVEYLKTRHLSWGSVKSFRIGYVANPLPGHEDYRGKISIPYITRSGVVTMRFRALPDQYGPKYLSLPNELGRIYNPNDLGRREPYVCLCEGEVDTITAHQVGLPAVGVPGAHAWQPYFEPCFEGYERVYVLADNDRPKVRPNCQCGGDNCKGHNPGREFADMAISKLGNAQLVMLPVDYDVNGFVAEHGGKALLDLIGVEL